MQRCIIHQLRYSFRFVNYKHRKEFARDLKEVYRAVNEEVALESLAKLNEKWGKKYAYAITSWQQNWDILAPFFKFPLAVRRIMYTTNIIEGVHRQFRKVTKTKSVFPSNKSLEKMLYLASQNVIKKWTNSYQNWDEVLNQLMVFYGERLAPYALR